MSFKILISCLTLLFHKNKRLSKKSIAEIRKQRSLLGH